LSRRPWTASETGEIVDDVARAKAGEMIAQREARRQREAQKAALRQATVSAMNRPAIAVRSD
jgi:Arc/MetJ family transcription regulator